MKKFTYSILGLFMILGVVSCNEDLFDQENFSTESLAETTAVEVTTPAVCGTTVYPLWAGQTIDAGSLTVSNDATNLYVTYTTTSTFGTLHLWAGTDLTLLPSVGSGPNAGTPIPGQFPYSFDASGLTTYTFTLPLSSLSFYNTCGDKLYVVAHAEVNINGDNETAFGGNISNNSGTARWYYYAEYVTVCCENPPPPSNEKLGTAFAKGGYVFTTDRKSNPESLPTLGLSKNRWGWSINLTSAGSTSYDLYVGAGLNFVSKGKLVGNVTVNFTGSQATVTYNLNSGFSIEEGHVYAGDFKPTTIAPGQYGNTFYFNPFASTFSTTLDVSDSNGDGIWLIVHAVAYGPGVTNP
jgi:hypothetical protein